MTREFEQYPLQELENVAEESQKVLTLYPMDPAWVLPRKILTKFIDELVYCIIMCARSGKPHHEMQKKKTCPHYSFCFY